MACTPHKSVQWSNKNEVNEFAYGSPYSEASSTDSINTTSTFQYINSQLVAHGFARGAGVVFDGLSKEDADRLSKCMLAMLSQRNEDMSRVEDLSTKMRTLSYEHERLATMHRSTIEQLAAAERETNLFKSRLASSNKQLQASETAHRTTSAELQRNRSTMQSVRQTYAAELKRREKETEKMMDRWQKISDAQTKLGSTASGLRFKTTLANSVVVSNRDGEMVRKGPDVVEDALDEAQAARKELVEENTSLKNVVLSAANELSRICHAIRMRIGESSGEEAPRFSLSEMFSISAPESASEKFNVLLTSFQEVVARLGVNSDSESMTPSDFPPSGSNLDTMQASGEDCHRGDSKELLRLQNTIVNLRRQLEQAQTQQQTSTYADEAQAIIRRFLNDDDEKATVQERHLLEKIRKELDHARKKVDEAALTLKDEKAALEEERQAFYREQRLWRSQMAIPHDGEGSSKPTNGLGAYFQAPVEPLEIPISPPRPVRKGNKNVSAKIAASPRKPIPNSRSPARPTFAVGKVGKKARNAGTPKKPVSSLLGASTMRHKVIPPMETEVMPSAPTLPTTASLQSLIVPNSFVLPPPSPLASLPPKQSELLSTKPLAGPSFGDNEDLDEEEQSSSHDPKLDAQYPGPKRPFPVAKPLAQHMFHAYSPAQPSPLSRILLLANSPAQVVPALEDMQFDAEADEEGDQFGSGPSSGSGPIAAMMLEEELGLEDLTGACDESPLRAKNKRLASKGKGTTRMNNAVKAGVKPKTFGLRDSTKTVSRETNKENGYSRQGPARPNPAPSGTRQLTTVKPLLAGKGGARRVPIGSVDAAPMGPGWK